MKLDNGGQAANHFSLSSEVRIVKRILLTGLSGTGKSTTIGELAARGYKAVDADSEAFSE